MVAQLQGEQLGLGQLAPEHLGSLEQPGSLEKLEQPESLEHLDLDHVSHAA